MFDLWEQNVCVASFCLLHTKTHLLFIRLSDQSEHDRRKKMFTLYFFLHKVTCLCGGMHVSVLWKKERKKKNCKRHEIRQQRSHGSTISWQWKCAEQERENKLWIADGQHCFSFFRHSIEGIGNEDNVSKYIQTNERTIYFSLRLIHPHRISKLKPYWIEDVQCVAHIVTKQSQQMCRCKEMCNALFCAQTERWK